MPIGMGSSWAIYGREGSVSLGKVVPESLILCLSLKLVENSKLYTIAMLFINL